MRSIRPAVTRLVLALTVVASFGAMACEATPAHAAPGAVVGSFSYQDLDAVKTGILSFDAVFPVGNHFALGPVVEYTYAKVETETTETLTVTAPFATLTEGGEQPPATITYTSEDEDSLSIISAGIRLALYVQKSHNGFGFSLEGIWPQHDAEGVLATPGVFFEGGIGSKGLFRVEYQHPFHLDNGEEIDLEGWRVAGGFGRRW